VNIPADERYPKQTHPVLDHRMSCIDVGSGDPIIFLHGNPTSSYLWRNVIPHVEARGRCVAPDLIGMGDSQKLSGSGPDRYTFEEHRRFLDAFLEVLGVRENVTLVLHDWGSALGFDWAARHPEAIRGIAYMEAIVAPMTWDDWPPPVRKAFQAFRSEAGEDLILEQNAFVEQILPGAVLRDLDDETMAVYRRPFAEAGEDRRPTLTWPRQIPIEGEPANVARIVENYGAWLQQSPVPKLFVNANPGAILRGAPREFCRRWPNQTEVLVDGVHFVQEDSPDEIGSALAEWLQGLD
jgi:haloalkane dehalogenase